MQLRNTNERFILLHECTTLGVTVSRTSIKLRIPFGDVKKKGRNINFFNFHVEYGRVKLKAAFQFTSKYCQKVDDAGGANVAT